MPRTPAETLADEQLDPLITWVDAKRGRKSELVLAVQKAAEPEQPGRTLIEAWIHVDKAKRKNPNLPNGLLLLKVGNELMKSTPPETAPE